MNKTTWGNPLARVCLLGVFFVFSACADSSSTGPASSSHSEDGDEGGIGDETGVEGGHSDLDLGGGKLAITILSPPVDTAILVETPFALSARVHVGDTPISNATVTWTNQSTDEPIASGVTGVDGVSLLDAEGLSAGLHPLRVAGVTASGEEAVATIDLRVVGEPSAPLVTLIPESPGAADTLKAEILEHSSALGADEVVYQYQWQVNGSLIANETTEYLPPSFAFRGDEVGVEVTPLAYGYPGPSGQATTVIGNTPPDAKGAFIDPAQGHANTSFECLAEGWGDVDGDAPSDWIRWELNGQVIEGVESPILPLGVAGRGDAIRCELTPHDGVDAGNSKWSPSVVLGNAPPSVASAAVAPDPGSVSAVFTCHGNGIHDPDGDAVSLHISWFVNDILVESEGESLAGASLVKGDFVACAIEPDDGELVGEPVLSPAIQIGNASPVGMTPTISPAQATVLDVLVCDAPPAVDPDGDDCHYLYTWSVNGIPVGGEQSLTAPAFERGDSVVCIVTPTDGVSTGPSMSSEPVVIGNAPPSAGFALISPQDANALTTLICEGGGEEDADGDSVTWSYIWKVNDVENQESGQSLFAPAFEKGDAVVCMAIPFDGISAGSEVISEPVLIGNAPPTVGMVQISPQQPTSASILSCEVGGAFDPDGDELSFVVSWKVNDQMVASGEDIKLESPAFAGGDEVVCLVMASDGEQQSPSVESAPVVIGNTPPSVEEVVLSPANPTILDTLLCEPLGYVDADDDPPEYFYQWTYNGDVLPFEAGAQLDVPFGSKGAEIMCSVIPFDGIDEGESVASEPVIVANAPPIVGNVQIIPGSGNQNTLFTCFASLIVDPDGDEVALSYAWFVNESKIPGASDSVLSNVQFPENALLYCEVTPNDGADAGPPKLSPPATLINTPPSIESALLVPAEPTTEDDLECVPGGWFDVDDDAPQYLFAWLLDGQITGNDSSVVSQDQTSRGQDWQCQIYPYDGLDIGTPIFSNVVEVGNTPPAIDSVWVTPENATSLSVLECHFDGWFDPDGDEEKAKVGWTVNGEPMDWFEGTLSASQVSIGDMVRCEVTPYDEEDDGEPVLSSNTVEIINAPPQVQVLSPLNVQVGTGDIVLFSASVSDIEDEADGLVVSWESDMEGILYEGAPSGGISEFTWAGLTPGQHQITVTATDTLGASGSAEVVLVVGFICGATSEMPTELESDWFAGFEQGNLTDWDLASYRFFVSEHLVPATCDFDEYTIQDENVISGNYALTLTPKQDDYLLVKFFGETVSSASFEGWVYLPGGAGLKAGFVSSPWEGTPNGYETNGFMNLISPTKAIFYGGNDTLLNLNAPEDEWFLFRLARDGDSGTMSVYVNNIFQTTLFGLENKPLAGFAVGMTDVYDVMPDGHLDDFSFIVE